MYIYIYIFCYFTFRILHVKRTGMAKCSVVGKSDCCQEHPIRDVENKSGFQLYANFLYFRSSALFAVVAFRQISKYIFSWCMNFMAIWIATWTEKPSWSRQSKAGLSLSLIWTVFGGIWSHRWLLFNFHECIIMPLIKLKDEFKTYCLMGDYNMNLFNSLLIFYILTGLFLW